MSSLHIRPCQPEDREQLLQVWSLTYCGNDPLPLDSTIFEGSEHFVAEAGGEIQGGFGIATFEMTRGEALLKCAGVLAVATAPSARNTGVAKKMMLHAIREFRMRGYDIAALYGFKESFYRPFGYEACGSFTKITVESARMPKFQQHLPVRVLGVNDVEAIRICHETFVKSRSGAVHRSPEQWLRVLGGKDTKKTIYAVGDPVEAFAILQHDGAFWGDQWVEHLCWTTSRGYESVLSVLRGIAVNKMKISWFEPSESPYLASYRDFGCKPEVERTAMYRILNPLTSLQKLKPLGSGSFTFKLMDPEQPENEGPWNVDYAPGSVAVSKAEHADLTLDRRHFIQALLGEPSLESLLRLDLARSTSDANARAACDLLTPCCVFCPDFF
jgi:predicted acetyltransferase